MTDVIEKLRFVRNMGTRVILDQEDVIELMAIIDEKQTGKVDEGEDSNLDPLLFYPPITMK